jgi:N-acetylglucosaminyl-diphospho-decaprenol L-rhamnosyltransferase
MESSLMKPREPLTQLCSGVSVIVVTYNSADEIRQCINSILSQEIDEDVEVIVVDNNSKDGTANIIRAEYPGLVLIDHGINAGFAAANNLAFRRTSGEYIVLVNPDSKLERSAIAASIRYMEKTPRCGLLGGLLVDENGDSHPSARKFPTALGKLITMSGLAEKFSSSRFFGGSDFRWFDHQSPLEVDWVPGAFTCIRRALIEEIGFFDERYFLYYEETDLCLRARQNGWTIDFIPDCIIQHEGGASSRKLEGQTFDSAGSQVRRFRMMAECLYHRKNHGYYSVIANIGVEIAWHLLRRLVNLRPGQTAKAKRTYSREMVKCLKDALRETNYGRVCPPRPW